MYSNSLCSTNPKKEGEKRRHIMSQQDPGILSLPASSVTHWKWFLCFISWVVGCQFDLPCNIVFNSRNFRSRTRGPQNIVNNIVHLMLKQCVCRSKTWSDCTQWRMGRIGKPACQNEDWVPILHPWLVFEANLGLLPPCLSCSMSSKLKHRSIDGFLYAPFQLT